MYCSGGNVIAFELSQVSVDDPFAFHRNLVWTQSIEGLGWTEIDYPLDLMRASAISAWTTVQRHRSVRTGEA